MAQTRKEISLESHFSVTAPRSRPLLFASSSYVSTCSLYLHTTSHPSRAPSLHFTSYPMYWSFATGPVSHRRATLAHAPRRTAPARLPALRMRISRSSWTRQKRLHTSSRRKRTLPSKLPAPMSCCVRGCYYIFYHAVRKEENRPSSLLFNSPLDGMCVTYSGFSARLYYIIIVATPAFLCNTQEKKLPPLPCAHALRLMFQ